MSAHGNWQGLQPPPRCECHDCTQSRHPFAGMGFTPTATFAVAPDAMAETWREEGRREVYAQIAKVDPFSPSDSFCAFCGGSHEPDCLWVKAQQVKA